MVPIGPVLVTPDALPDLGRLEIGCAVDGETVQQGTTADLVLDVPALVAYLSGVVELMPGDLVFTGTPARVGQGRTLPRFLTDGSVLTSWITGLGEIEHRLRR